MQSLIGKHITTVFIYILDVCNNYELIYNVMSCTIKTFSELNWGGGVGVNS